jgi:hypothetical protein
MKQFIIQTAWLGLLVLTCMLAGCKTTDAAHSGSLASVIVSGHTAEEIQQTTIDIFGWNGYARVTDLIFEKQGSKWDSMNYGSLGGKPVWIKMCVTLTTKGPGWYVLGCDAYVVDGHGEGFMETEQKLKFAKADDCKKILDQIKQRLSLQPAKSS